MYINPVNYWRRTLGSTSWIICNSYLSDPQLGHNIGLSPSDSSRNIPSYQYYSQGLRWQVQPRKNYQQIAQICSDTHQELTEHHMAEHAEVRQYKSLPCNSTSTQIFFTGVITSMASTIHGKFGVNDLRWLGCRNKTCWECVQGWQIHDWFDVPLSMQAACWMLPSAWWVCDKSVQMCRQTWLTAACWTTSETNKKKIPCNRQSIIL